jgi:hypothetical protein
MVKALGECVEAPSRVRADDLHNFAQDHSYSMVAEESDN